MVLLPDGMMEPDVLAECVVQTMAREEFLILPHPEVLDYLSVKWPTTTAAPCEG